MIKAISLAAAIFTTTTSAQQLQPGVEQVPLQCAPSVQVFDQALKNSYVPRILVRENLGNATVIFVHAKEGNAVVITTFNQGKDACLVGEGEIDVLSSPKPRV